MFDTAEGYAEGKSEIELCVNVAHSTPRVADFSCNSGRVIKELNYNRADLVISTKIFFGTGKKHPNQGGLSRKQCVHELIPGYSPG